MPSPTAHANPATPRDAPLRDLVRLWLLLGCGACQCGTSHLGALQASIAVAPQSLDFGATGVGATVTRSLRFENRGAARLEVSALALTGAAAGEFDVALAPFELGPGSARALVVRYRPGATGTHVAQLQVESDADDSPQLRVPLLGLAVKEPGPGPDPEAPDAGAPVVDAGPTPRDAGTAGPDLFVTLGHVELRSVLLGHPNGAQAYVSNDTRAELVNNTAAPVEVTLRLADPLGRFFWSSGVTMAQRPEVVMVLGPHQRVQPSVQWNSGDDNGTAGDPCAARGPSALEFVVDGGVVARVTVHGKSRMPFTCPGALVTWSDATPNSGGPCRAQVPARLENFAQAGSDEVSADPQASDLGYAGAQGVTCAADTWATDACGASVPTSGAPVRAWARNAGAAACVGP